MNKYFFQFGKKDTRQGRYEKIKGFVVLGFRDGLMELKLQRGAGPGSRGTRPVHPQLSWGYLTP